MPNIKHVSIPYPGFDYSGRLDSVKVDANNSALVNKMNEVIEEFNARETVVNQINENFLQHLTSSAHDGRYLGKDVEQKFDRLYANHKGGGDHDARYPLKSDLSGVEKKLAANIESTKHKIESEAKHLQGQLNEVARGATNAEAAQARVDENGISHGTLKARIDSSFGAISEQLAETTTYDVVVNKTAKKGFAISTQGFYSLGDKGGGMWTLADSTGSEVWTSTGYGFEISNDCEIKYSQNEKLVFLEKSASTKQLGCKADDSSDDSVIMLKIFKCTKFNQVHVDEGKHIINITPTSDRNARYFCYFTAVSKVTGVQGKSVIKLGSGNCDERNYRGFAGIFHYYGVDLDVSWEGITFDYNPTKNPLYHYGSRFVSLESNVRQSSVYAIGIRDFTFKNNEVIGHSGSNSVVYTPTRANSRDAIVDVSYNKFLDIGAESGSGVHDHSTLYVHTYYDNPKKLISYIHHNEFYASEIGAANAFNAYEGSPDIGYIHNNYVHGYWCGSLEVAVKEENIIRNYGNVYENVSRGVGLWTKLQDDEKEGFAYDSLEIKNNSYILSPELFSNKVNFLEYTMDTSTGYVPHLHHGIFSNYLQKDIRNLTLDNNTIKYLGSNAYKTLSAIAINIGDLYGLNSRLTNTKLELLQITNNKIYNAPRTSVHYSTFFDTSHIKITNNEIYDSNINTSGLSDEPHSYVFYLTLNAASKDARFYVNNKTFDFENNKITGTAYKYVLGFNIQRNDANFNYSGKISLKNNKFEMTGVFQKPYSLLGYTGNALVHDIYPYNINQFLNLNSNFLSRVNNGEMQFNDGFWRNGKWTFNASDISLLPSVTITNGDEIMNANKRELGSEGSKYIIDKWVMVNGGWIENRINTGN